MAISSRAGVSIEATIAAGRRRDEHWFGEAPSRILLAVHGENLDRALAMELPAEISLTVIGQFGGDEIRLGDAAGIPVSAATAAFDGALRGE